VRTQIQRIESLLNVADVPQEVWIGTNSVADRVEWLTIRNKLNQNSSRNRHAIIETMADVLESALQTTCLGKELRKRAKKALVLAGRVRAECGEKEK
jgi:hypothetical protein